MVEKQENIVVQPYMQHHVLWGKRLSHYRQLLMTNMVHQNMSRWTFCPKLYPLLDWDGQIDKIQRSMFSPRIPPQAASGQQMTRKVIKKCYWKFHFPFYLGELHTTVLQNPPIWVWKQNVPGAFRHCIFQHDVFPEPLGSHVVQRAC